MRASLSQATIHENGYVCIPKYKIFTSTYPLPRLKTTYVLTYLSDTIAKATLMAPSSLGTYVSYGMYVGYM